MTYVVTGESHALGLIAIKEVTFSEDKKYIQVTQKMLNDFPYLDEGLKKADGYTGIDPKTNKITRQLSNPAVIELSNYNTKNFESYLEELSTPDSKHNNVYFLEYDEKYYSIGIIICFPQCPSFA